MDKSELLELIALQDAAFHELLTKGTREDLVALLIYFYSDYSSALQTSILLATPVDTVN